MNTYRSCYDIERGLIIDATKLMHCCTVIDAQYINTTICEFHWGELPIDVIKKSRDKYRFEFSKFDQILNFKCKNCNKLMKQQWTKGGGSYLFESLTINNTYVCNLYCNYCPQVQWGNEARQIKYNILPSLNQIFKNNLMSPEGYIFYAGGEPTLDHNFNDAIDVIFNYSPLINVRIDTNATLLSKSLLTSMYCGRKIDLLVSVDSGTKETYIKIKGKNFFDIVWKNLGEYAATGGKVEVKFLITNDNILKKDLDGFITQVDMFKIFLFASTLTTL
jgi:sulfatase maturation enzyme AslB (radical SAM superfamily)